MSSVSREDEEKLDAALAIASLSGGSWTEKPPSASARSKAKQMRTSTEKRVRGFSSPVSLLLEAPPAVERVKKKRRRRVKQTLSDPVTCNATPSLASAISKQTEADDRVKGTFVRSALHASVTDNRSQAASMDTSSSTIQSHSSVSLLESETADENQAEECTFLQIVPLSSLASSGMFISRSNNSQNNPFNPFIDPQIMHLLTQHYPHIFTGDFSCLNSTIQLNQSTLDKSEDEKLIEGIPTSSLHTSQLPGSLNTLRDYYINVSHASDASNHSMPSSASPSIVSDLISTSNTQQTIVFDIKEKATNCISSKIDEDNYEKNLSLPQGTVVRCTLPKTVLEKHSVGVMNSRDSNSSESSVVKMPGSLDILKKYYSSLGQKPNQLQVTSSLSRTSDNPQLTLSNSNARTSATISDEEVLNLSKQYLSNDHKEKLKIADISDRGLMIGVQKNQPIHLSPDHKTLRNTQLRTGVSKSVSLPVTNLMQGAQYLLSSEELNSESQILASPLRILPKIRETSKLSASSNQSGESHRFAEQTDSNISENSVFSSIIPPKSRTAPNASQIQFDNFSVLMGEEIVSFPEFLSRLNGSQSQTIDPIQSGNFYQQRLMSSPSLLTQSILTNGNQLFQNRQDSLSCFSIDDLNRGPVLLDADPEACATPLRNGILLPDDCMENHIMANEDSNSQTHSIHRGQKRSRRDLNASKKRLLESPTLLSSPNPSRPILQPDEDGDLPLHIAVAQGKRDVVQRLAQTMNKLNATIDCRNINRQTPLHLGVVTGDCEIVEVLLGAGASPNIADRKGQNCFHLAVQYQQTECLQRLFTCCSESHPDILNYEGMTALHLAVKSNQTDAIVTLLENGARPDVVDGKSGHTPLFMAADTNRLKAAEILLSSGASAQIASYSGYSPVQAAFAKSFNEMVKLLAKYGATSEHISSDKFKQL